MEKEFVPYELAVRMKALGFDYNILGFYYDNKLLEHCCGNTEVKDLEKGDVPAPTFSQAFRWFREKYGIHSFIDCKWKNLGWQYELVDLNKMESISTIGNYGYNTPEEAELACLDKLLEIVESKSK